jgi:hypothetical protein
MSVQEYFPEIGSDLTVVTWGHAVNSRQKLHDALTGTHRNVLFCWPFQCCTRFISGRHTSHSGSLARLGQAAEFQRICSITIDGVSYHGNRRQQKKWPLKAQQRDRCSEQFWVRFVAAVCFVLCSATFPSTFGGHVRRSVHGERRNNRSWSRARPILWPVVAPRINWIGHCGETARHRR